MKHFTLPKDGGLIEKDLPKGILHSYEKINTEIFDDADLASEKIADIIAKAISDHRKAGLPRLFKIGFSSGNTPKTLFPVLVRKYEAGEISFADVEVFAIDEYFPCETNSARSRNCRLRDGLVNQVDFKKENVHIIDATVPQGKVSEYCAEFEKIAKGLDLLVIGVGNSGEVGFNEAGALETSRTRTVALSLKGRKIQARNFNGDLSVTPKAAITMGISTMMSARRIILMA
ncbi:MAG: 6-phosphogluconolactonase, partial [Bacteroidales bacterium]|nr:6-phosphogluconolactonase [Candidatus Cryptobacteroides faecihippi]